MDRNRICLCEYFPPLAHILLGKVIPVKMKKLKSVKYLAILAILSFCAGCADQQVAPAKADGGSMSVTASTEDKGIPHSANEAKPVQVVTAAEFTAYIDDFPAETRKISEQSMLASPNRKFLLLMTNVMASYSKCKELQLDAIITDPNAVKADGDIVTTQVTRLAAPNTKDLLTGALKQQTEGNGQVFDRTEHWIYKGCDDTNEVTVFYREIHKGLSPQSDKPAGPVN